MGAAPLTFDGYRADLETRRLFRGGEALDLSPKAFDFLVLLLHHRGQVMDKAELMRLLWPDTFVDESNLNVHISAIRKALGETAQCPRYIETIPGRGYRFRELNVETAPPRGKRMLLAAALAAVILGSLLYAHTHSGSPVEKRFRSIAVLPFQSIGKPGSPLGEGMADSLITRMSALKFDVRPMTAVLRYEGTNLHSIEAGRKLEVDTVLEGSIQNRGDQMRVTVRLIRVADGRPLWGAHYVERVSDLFEVQDAIATKVVEALRLELSAGERGRLLARPTKSVAAYELYVAGRHFWNKRTAEGLRKALASFQKAIDEDPNYALAYAGLADVYSLLGDYTGNPKEYHLQAEAAAKRALELDERIAEAHVSLAYLRMRAWNWPNVESEFRRAFELNPNYATGHQWYSIFLELMGRSEEAIREAERAREIDPLSPIINESLGSRLYFARRPDRAMKVLRRTIELEPSFQLARESLTLMQTELGMHEDAGRLLTEGPGDRSMSLARAYLLARSGRAREALALVETLQDQDLVELARIHEALGNHDQALALLENALRQHLDHLVFIKVDPSWDRLRAHPRFVALLRAMRLAEI